MKLILVGDLHLRGSSPRSRIDNFPNAQFDKFEQVLSLVDQPRSDTIVLQAGDFCDSSSVGNIVLNRYVDSLYREVDHDCGSFIYAVFGQHDMYMWNLSHIDKTSLGVFLSAGLVQLLGGAPTHTPWTGSVELYGASWGQPIPKPSDEEVFKVLVVHGAIGDKPLFTGHDLMHPSKFVRKNPGYDLILCGDYHYPFEFKVGGTLIVNPGALCRQSISEKDIVPSVIEYDLGTHKYEWKELIYNKNAFVDNPELSNVSTLAKSQLENFVQQLEAKESLTISFSNNVRVALENTQVSEAVKSKILDVLSRCEDETWAG